MELHDLKFCCLCVYWMGFCDGAGLNNVLGYFFNYLLPTSCRDGGGTRSQIFKYRSRVSLSGFTK